MEWDDKYVTPKMTQFTFEVATLLICIVMLNLLIAIVSEVYEEIIQAQQEANDYERVSLIADTAEFIKPAAKEELCKQNEFLIKAELAGKAEHKSDEKA